MLRVLLFNKPCGVLCQFSPSAGKRTLKDFIPVPDVYAAGRLDADSEGLVVLTDDGKLQHAISDPKMKLSKTYWVQVEGEPDEAALRQLRSGVDLGDFVTRPAGASHIDQPSGLWERIPPIRVRKSIPTCWIELELHEGKNRQIRRMTAAAGYPTLRLIRVQIGHQVLPSLRVRLLVIEPERGRTGLARESFHIVVDQHPDRRSGRRRSGAVTHGHERQRSQRPQGEEPTASHHHRQVLREERQLRTQPRARYSHHPRVS